jgi:hypothetical protein
MKNLGAFVNRGFITKNSVFIALFVFMSQNSYAIDIPVANDWKFTIRGYVETDLIHDSTRSFREISGNAPVARPGTFDGENGRTQMSLRNTRIVFSMAAPEEENLKQNVLLAVDFLGYNPSPGTVPPTNTETFFYTNPGPRLLLGFYTIETNDWKFLAGLAGSLFAWEPRYFLTTASVPPVSGTVYVRPPQLTAIKTFFVNEGDKLQVGLSVTRPTQRDSEIPNLDGGLKFTFGNRKAGFSTAAGDTELESTSLALSGTYRQFLVPSLSATSPQERARKYGGALAMNIMAPLIAAESGDVGNTLILTGEYTFGSGYSDYFVGATGNIPQLPAGAPGSLSSVTSLDPGIGGYDSAGEFSLVKLQTWNTQLQYHFPFEQRSFVTLGYGQLHIMNSEKFTPLPGLVLYDKAETYFIGFFRDLTKRTRIAFEYDRVSTHYVDGVSPVNNRFQFSTWIRF